MALALLRFRTFVQRLAGERGASIVEYALLIALLAVVCLIAVNTIGDPTSKGLNEAGSSGFVP